MMRKKTNALCALPLLQPNFADASSNEFKTATCEKLFEKVKIRSQNEPGNMRQKQARVRARKCDSCTVQTEAFPTELTH